MEDLIKVQWPSWAVAVLPTALCIIFAVARLLPIVDSREPPKLHPTVPFIGHIITLIRKQAGFLKTINQDAKVPVATLPMLHGKLYAVYDPALIQNMFRNNQLSFIPFASEFAKKQLDLREDTVEIMKTTNMVQDFFSVIHPALSGSPLHRMNRNALRSISTQLNDHVSSAEWVEIPNFYLWLRDLMTFATCDALYGSENFLRKHPEMLDDVWIFEEDLGLLLLDVFPKWTASRVWKARERLQEQLMKYYNAKFDHREDAAEITRARADSIRGWLKDDNEVGRIELALLHAATANSIPAMFWLATFIISEEGLVEQLREEAAPMLQKDGNKMTIDITQLEKECPLLASAYKETLRVSVQGSVNRRVMEETTISDGKGNTYLLKKGVDIQASSNASHARQDAWGLDADTFSADRFTQKTEESQPANEKLKRSALHPFGGGRHLCPGRNFAAAENLGLAAALVLGYEFCPLEGEAAPWKRPAMQNGSLTSGTVKPINHGEGFGVRLRRRPGWEKVEWHFTC